MDSIVRREIRFNKTSCYFCSEWLENDNFEGHLKQCGQVLEKCPNYCLAFVQRKEMPKHLTECPKVTQPVSRIKNDDLNHPVDNIEQRLLILEQDISALRSTVNEEIRQRLHLITDISSLKKHNQVSDEWTNKVSEVLNALKKCLNEETKSRCIDMTKFRKEIDKLLQSFNDIENWRVETSMRLDEMNSSITIDDNLRGHIDVLLNDNSTHITKINRLNADINELKFEFNEHINVNDKELIEFSERFKTLDSVLLGQNNTIQTIKGETTEQLNGMILQNQQQFDMFNNLSNKQLKLDYEIKSVKHITCETEDKCDKLEKIVNEYKTKSAKSNQNLLDLETHMKSQNQLMSIHNTRGHLIWRIDCYTEKLKEAKENDTVLRSPLFCNRQYSYTLRLDVHLNGIGNWKGRNIIACLTVVPGEYDPLLLWPCKLQADIILRDQPDNLQDSKNYYKTCSVKRKNEQMETNQYIHIPHRIIETCNFLREDCIFLEVRCHSMRK